MKIYADYGRVTAVRVKADLGMDQQVLKKGIN
jgi:hypothetical protein